MFDDERDSLKIILTSIQVIAFIAALPLILLRLFAPMIWWSGLVYLGLQGSIIGVGLWCIVFVILAVITEWLGRLPEKAPTQDEVSEFIADATLCYIISKERKTYE